MYKNYRYINAGDNEYYRWGKKAQEKLKRYLEPNKDGFYSIPADGGKYWTIGTSEGRYGEYAKFKGQFISVNKAGYVWAKVGTEKEKLFLEMVNDMLNCVVWKMDHMYDASKEDEDDEEEEEV